MRKCILTVLLACSLMLALAACSNSSISQPNNSAAQGIDVQAENATANQRKALNRAKTYLASMPFSCEGLVEQLEYEGFSVEDAAYAAENCGANWNAQAVQLAKSYLIASGFSYSGLVEQLEFEGFTKDQATYGADNCDADWNEQAAKAAKSYLRSSSFSHSELISQLEYEGFTPEEVAYGVAAAGFPSVPPSVSPDTTIATDPGSDSNATDDRGIPGMKATAIRYTLKSEPFAIPVESSKSAPNEASEIYAASYVSLGLASDGMTYDYSITVDNNDEIIGATFAVVNATNGSDSGLLHAADLFFYVVSLLDYDTARQEDLSAWFKDTLPTLGSSGAETIIGDAKFELYVIPGFSYWVDISKALD